MALYKLLYEIEPLIMTQANDVTLVCDTHLQAEILANAITETIGRQQAENKD